MDTKNNQPKQEEQEEESEEPEQESEVPEMDIEECKEKLEKYENALLELGKYDIVYEEQIKKIKEATSTNELQELKKKYSVLELQKRIDIEIGKKEYIEFKINNKDLLSTSFNEVKQYITDMMQKYETLKTPLPEIEVSQVLGKELKKKQQSVEILIKDTTIWESLKKQIPNLTDELSNLKEKIDNYKDIERENKRLLTVCDKYVNPTVRNKITADPKKVDLKLDKIAYQGLKEIKESLERSFKDNQKKLYLAIFHLLPESYSTNQGVEDPRNTLLTEMYSKYKTLKDTELVPFDFTKKEYKPFKVPPKKGAQGTQGTQRTSYGKTRRRRGSKHRRSKRRRSLPRIPVGRPEDIPSEDRKMSR